MNARVRRLGCALLGIGIVFGGLGCAGFGARRSSASTKPADGAALGTREWVRAHYTKHEFLIPMRDGVRLFTAVYEPKDKSRAFPILMVRSPYSVRPYGEDQYRRRLGPTKAFDRDGYIFVYQDVRGCWMSEGEFDNMRPHLDVKNSPADIDESSDTYDTIEWLIEHLPHHNGKVGMWGNSYPGFYAAAGMIDAHPALVAVSPQAPIADWWYDDFHHHGALFLPHAFGFMSGFGQPRPEPTKTRPGRPFEYGTPDGYQFYMDLGPLSNVNEKYLHGDVRMWNEHVEHPNYDAFWQARNILPHLKNISPAVMTVGGWFDAEDLYGALNVYREAERLNPDVSNILVMGPWAHGAWNRGGGERLGNIEFGSQTSKYFQEHIIRPFFRHHLKGEGELDLPEAHVFETGANQWHQLERWPPEQAEQRNLYCRADGVLSFEPPSETDLVFDQYVSDPAKPVPFTSDISRGMTRAYMTDDQRFAARRPDVLVYQTEVLEEGVTLAGPILADLRVSTSGTSSDWIVKLIDVFPPDAPNHKHLADGQKMGGYQMMVRSEVIRGRFRHSYQHPEPFVPNEPTRVPLKLQDVFHTFQAGHRIMIQIQSTWFPLVDRNPQTYVDNIFLAEESDFVPATQRVYRSTQQPTHFTVGVLPAAPPSEP